MKNWILPYGELNWTSAAMECTNRNAELLNSFSECSSKAFEALKELEFQLSAEEIERTIMENRLEYYRRFVTENFPPVIPTRDGGTSTDSDDATIIELKSTAASALTLGNCPSLTMVGFSDAVDQCIQCTIMSDGDLSVTEVDVIPPLKTNQLPAVHSTETNIQTVLCSVANPRAVASEDILLDEKGKRKDRNRSLSRRLRCWFSKRARKN